MIEKLKKASSMDLQIWMWGAGMLGLGLGVLLAGYIGFYAIGILLIGLLMHGWAMYKIYTRK